MEPCVSWNCINGFANWLSAIGTVAATVLALWLSLRDRRVNIAARLSLGLVPGADPRVLNRRVFALEFTNIGPRPVTVTNHVWRLPFSRHVIVMFPNIDTPVARLCSTLPVELSDGKSGHVFYPIDHFAKLDDPAAVFFHSQRAVAWCRIRFFRLYLATSVGKRIRVRIHRAVRRELWKQYRSA